MPRSSTDARRYAEAAFQVATEDRKIDEWNDALARAAAAYANAEVAEVLNNPTLPGKGREDVLQRVLVQPVPRQVLNLIGLLMQRRRIELLPLLASEFQRLVDRRNGVTTANA
ncbi:MAG: ATP synthase F1 subunit delta, partial [Chloroflexi bacterium]|nr:ATP synthase F1 subunit delta [Chloroflexota bacterium]